MFTDKYNLISYIEAKVILIWGRQRTETQVRNSTFYWSGICFHQYKKTVSFTVARWELCT